MRQKRRISGMERGRDRLAMTPEMWLGWTDAQRDRSNPRTYSLRQLRRAYRRHLRRMHRHRAEPERTLYWGWW